MNRQMLNFTIYIKKNGLNVVIGETTDETAAAFIAHRFSGVRHIDYRGEKIITIDAPMTLTMITDELRRRVRLYWDSKEETS